MTHRFNRRAVIAGIAGAGALCSIPSSLHAQSLGDILRRAAPGDSGLNLSSILGKASDNALDKLAEPGAYYDDEDIRIGLPIVGRRRGLFGRVLNAGSELGLLDGVTRKINDAAGVAAGEAKPIFRDAIDDLSFSDAPGIIREKDGGTQYLRSSANDRLHERLEPLIDDALEAAGVYSTFDGLAEQHSFIRRAGLDRAKINRTVTDQGLDGIFAYIGAEERDFRDDPIGGLLGN